jgi:hypothetical protein
MRVTCQCECKKSMKSNISPSYAVNKGGGRERKTRDERQNRWMTTSSDGCRCRTMKDDEWRGEKFACPYEALKPGGEDDLWI